MNDQDPKIVDLRDAPVSIELDALGDHDSVLTALAQRYELEGHRTRQLWVGDLPDGTSAVFDLAVSDEKLLIDVETIDTLSSLDSHRYTPWRRAGYEVWIVAPDEKLSQVTKRMKDSVDHIQGWSKRGPQVRFAIPVI